VQSHRRQSSVRDLSEGGLRGAAAGHNEGDMKMAQYDEYAVHQDEIV